ncbi:flagellar assembly protein FliW [uncultured Selenomonas sp.]|uniref:flagellar assembly protein FliW n=1 Tax=uncultured Selenomonas sp. TaxID=159275 RepID=UPI0025F25157|nr:flagellar assembly protein FliW [uncultured Selenomonas sp.]
MKKVDTVRFGTIEIDEKTLVHFGQGIPAFEDEHEFVIIPYDEESPYVFLQSTTTPDLAFLMTVPYLFFKDYEFEIDDETVKKLGLESPDDVVVYVLLTIPQGRIEDMTANLMAPVIINQKTLAAKQLVLEKSPYTTKHRLFEKKAEAGKEAR